MAQFRKKIGTVALRYMFELTILNVSMDLPYLVNLSVIFKKGPKRLETKQKPQIGEQIKKVEFNEALTMVSSINKNKQTGAFVEKNANLYIQFQKGEASKSVGRVKINLGEAVDVPEPIRKRVAIDKFKYDGFIEFQIKCTPAYIPGGDGVSCISDALSCDSGVDSEFDIEDFEEESKNPGGLRKGRKPATVIRTQIKNSSDPTKPPLMIGKAVSSQDGQSSGFDPQKLIDSSNSRQQVLDKSGSQEKVSESLSNKIKMLRASGFKKQTISSINKGDENEEIKTDRSLATNNADLESARSGTNDKVTISDIVKKRPASKIRLNRAPSAKGMEVIEEDKQEDNGRDSNTQLNSVNLEKISLNKIKSSPSGTHNTMPGDNQSQTASQTTLPSVLDRQLTKQNPSHQPLIIPSAQIFQQQQLAKKVESLEQEKVKLIEDYQKQLQQVLKDKDTHLQSANKFENQIHKIETERDKLQLKCQQNENQIQKLKNKIEDLENDNLNVQKQLSEQNSDLSKQQQDQQKQNQVQIQKLQEQLENSEKQLQDTKSRLKDKEKLIKQQESDIESLNQNLEKMRQQLIETKQSTASSQSQIEQSLKEKIVKLDREIEELKKDNRLKSRQVDDLTVKVEEDDKEREQQKFVMDKLENDKTRLQDQVKKAQEKEKEQLKQYDILKNSNKQKDLQAQQELEEMKRQLEQIEVEKNSALKLAKEKERKIKKLEDKIADLDQEKINQYNEYQEQAEAQKNMLELQMIDLKKRIQELTEKSDAQKQQISKQQEQITQLKQQLETANRNASKSPMRNNISKQVSFQDDQRRGRANSQARSGSTQQTKDKNAEDHELLRQNKELQDMLVSKEEESYITVMNLKQEVSRLQRQVKEGQNQKSSTNNDRELAKLSVENEMLKKQIEELQSRSSNMSSNNLFDQNGSKKAKGGNDDDSLEQNQLKLKVRELREENIQQHNEFVELAKVHQNMEELLVKAKMQAAELDLENDDLSVKINKKNEMLKKLSAQVTMLETELVRSKQDLGEALNAVYEYEQTGADRELMTQIESNMTFKEGQSQRYGGNNGSNDSLDIDSNSSNSKGNKQSTTRSDGSGAKKNKTTDKIKNFFGKSKK
eukprot:403360298